MKLSDGIPFGSVVLAWALLASACTTAVPGAGAAAPAFKAERFATSPVAALADVYPRANVAFGGGVTGYPGLTYAQPAGFRPNTLDLYVPAGAKRGERFPLIVFIHGGGWTSGHTRHSGAFSDWPSVLAGISEHGYVVASLNYRLAPEAPSPAAIHDVKAAVKWLRSQATVYSIDPARAYSFGGSAGGQLAGLLATSCGVAELDPPAAAMALPGRTEMPAAQSDCVQGAAIWYGVFDFAPLVASSPAGAQPNAYLGCRPSECSADAVRRASAAAYIDAKDPPFLLVHGDKDRVVSVEQSRQFAAALKAKGVPVTLDVIADVDHSFIGATPEATRAASLRAIAQTVAFFDSLSGKGG